MEKENKLEEIFWKDGKFVNVKGEKINPKQIGDIKPHVFFCPLPDYVPAFGGESIARLLSGKAETRIFTKEDEIKIFLNFIEKKEKEDKRYQEINAYSIDIGFLPLVSFYKI
ncbi:MAG: hypothetical protein AABY32_03615 [Nanoarchaeota archaeon]